MLEPWLSFLLFTGLPTPGSLREGGLVWGGWLPPDRRMVAHANSTGHTEDALSEAVGSSRKRPSCGNSQLQPRNRREADFPVPMPDLTGASSKDPQSEGNRHSPV